ncbi:CD209 antigen-like protein E [Perca fluviatilis]|uniref:CD209 antigen-like protein E n=1 Tax=Perca fluviatilis TaxID=8168 RepID=UPI0019664B8D|nr:CD209 antigen-like protein E [Perca fluviatilis]
MSEDIYANQDKVRYNRNVQKDKKDCEEREVTIYEIFRNDHIDSQSHGGVTLWQTKYDHLSNNSSQLQDEVKQLRNRTEEKWCPDRWTRFGRSCYIKYKENNTWDGSRADCQQRGAYLVIINNEEQQKFVSELSKDGEYWIGLRYDFIQGDWKWEWVDGSPLTETFWGAGQPQHGYSNTVTCCDQQGKWTKIYNETKNWICEKKMI